jgi:O-antigen polymerase
MNKYQNLFEFLKYLFFSIYIFFLPAAKVASIQSISIAAFIFLVVATEYKKWNLIDLTKIKKLLILFFVVLFLAYLSLFNSVDINETLKEANKGILKNVAIMIVLFFYFKHLQYSKTKIYFYILFSAFFIHTIINIFTWIAVGCDLSYRTGGLLDGYIQDGGGERFGIWATYAFGCAIAFFAFKNKSLATVFLILTIISIISNNTRATYIGVIIILIAVFFTFVYSNKIRIVSFVIVVLFGFIFYQTSHYVSADRYNIQLVPKYIELIKSSPKEMIRYKDMGLSESVPARLAMWKSVLIYRINEPFIPTGYGRFLYGKTIRKLNSDQNIPFCDYSQVHNEFLGIFFSLGIFGLLAFIGIWISYLKTAIQIARSSDVFTRVFGYFIFFGGLGFIASLFFGSFFGSSEAKLFYLTFGMVLGICYSKDFKNDEYSRA